MMNKRSAAAVLLGALLLSSAACAEAGKPQETTQEADIGTGAAEAVTEAAQTEAYDLPDADFGGYQFRIFSCNFINMELGEYITRDTLTGDLVNDALYQTTAEAEEKLNCDITILRHAYDPWKMAPAIKNLIQAGDDAFDLQINHDGLTASLSQEGMFCNLYGIRAFDFEKPWWPANILENLSIQNKLYFASSYLSYCGLHYTRAVILNKQKLADLHMEMPYQEVRDGTWTLDRMIAMAENAASDLNGDGKMDEEDFYGYASGSQTGYSMQESIDLMPYQKHADGSWELNLDLEKAEDFVSKMRHLMIESGTYIADDLFGAVPFSKGHALMACSTLQDVYDTYRMSNITYGIVPTPKYDERQESYISSSTDTFWAIPVTAEPHLDVISTIAETLNCLNYHHVIPAYFEIALGQKLADAPEDTEMLNLIRDTRELGFAFVYQMAFNDIVSDVVRLKCNFASFYAKREKGALRKLEKLMDTYAALE